MGVRTGLSLVVGAFVNYAILAPIMIEAGDIHPAANGSLGFKQIVFWSLWAGVAMMTMASLLVFFSKPQMIINSFAKLFIKRRDSVNVLGHIELPLSVSAIGIPIIGTAVVCLAQIFFGVPVWLSAIALILVFAFALIAINSTGLTSITPIGAMGKLTQLTFGGLAPGDIKTNLITGGICGEVASHSANLLQDIKPGYMLGAKPRQQAIGHVLGVLAGSVLSVPVFYLVFMQRTEDHTFSIDLQKYPMPSALTWKAVADILSGGIGNIEVSARWAAGFGLLAGLVLEVIRLRSRNRFPLSPLAIGLGFIIPFHTCLLMFVGGFIFWVLEKCFPQKDSKVNQTFVQNQEPISAGLIAGGALMGITVAVLEILIAPHK
jgi:uncharacterized oligopeptide transporter (OPT) family protein